ncbi:hypothetical protein GGS23DRAFT_209616 [Durotheca rogersii]|uniref:uncharacterized protein n=1 Tax=Durotheca rogersii TaxID=419775 RepID=UPI002220977D|nr:uncharacterized protein GGS23DRAFT_209616 [Durotheca rogersii]KAI5860782.1 hypothetical protein GGS23DRAFT_209616 [Durotheca rogersii]
MSSSAVGATCSYISIRRSNLPPLGTNAGRLPSPVSHVSTTTLMPGSQDTVPSRYPAQHRPGGEVEVRRRIRVAAPSLGTVYWRWVQEAQQSPDNQREHASSGSHSAGHSSSPRALSCCAAWPLPARHRLGIGSIRFGADPPLSPFWLSRYRIALRGAPYVQPRRGRIWDDLALRFGNSPFPPRRRRERCKGRGERRDRSRQRWAAIGHRLTGFLSETN